MTDNQKTLPQLYLEKRDDLSEREREAILTAIEWMNKPVIMGMPTKPNVIFQTPDHD